MQTKESAIETLNSYIENLTIFRDKIQEQMPSEISEDEEYEFSWIEDYDSIDVDYCFGRGDLELLRREKQYKKSTKMIPVKVEIDGKKEIVYRKTESVKFKGYSKWEPVLFS